MTYSENYSFLSRQEAFLRNATSPVSSQRDFVITQSFVPLFGHQIVVLDADAADSRYIESRLKGDHVAGKQRLIGFANEERRLRVSQSDPVTGVMREMLGHAFAIES